MTRRENNDARRPTPAAQPTRQRPDETGSTPGQPSGYDQGTHAKPGQKSTVRIEIVVVDGPDGTYLLARQAPAQRGSRTERTADDSGKMIVIVQPRDFRLPDVLRHIEAGKVVLVMPQPDGPAPTV